MSQKNQIRTELQLSPLHYNPTYLSVNFNHKPISSFMSIILPALCLRALSLSLTYSAVPVLLAVLSHGMTNTRPHTHTPNDLPAHTCMHGCAPPPLNTHIPVSSSQSPQSVLSRLRGGGVFQDLLDLELNLSRRQQSASLVHPQPEVTPPVVDCYKLTVLPVLQHICKGKKAFLFINVQMHKQLSDGPTERELYLFSMLKTYS